jgi:eukaryotic-like serine/threonine-protein kinase
MDQLHDRDPKSIGPYEVVALCGAGGMGRVYLCTSPEGARVAVKVLRADLADDDHFRTRFRREVASARRVHSEVTAEVIDADTACAAPWMATVFVDGPTLSKQVAAGPLSEPEVRWLALTLAEALQVIHDAGLVHRDLKPSNIIMAPGGPKVIDFGIALAAGATALTTTSTRIGSAGYVAPEQIRSGTTGPEADVFALGAVLAYAATGREPFGTGTADLVHFRVRHDEPNLDGVPAGLRPLVAACLAKDPGQRPTTAAILGGFRDDRPPRTPTQVLPTDPWPGQGPGPGQGPTRPVVVVATMAAGTRLVQPADVATRPGALPRPVGRPQVDVPTRVVTVPPTLGRPAAGDPTRPVTLPRRVAPPAADVPVRRGALPGQPEPARPPRRRTGRKGLGLVGAAFAAAVSVAAVAVAMAGGSPNGTLAERAPTPLTTTSTAPAPTSAAPAPAPAPATSTPAVTVGDVTVPEPVTPALTSPSESGTQPAKRANILVGSWEGHGRGLVINADGSVKASYRMYVFCSETPKPPPPCDGGAVFDGGQVTLHITKILRTDEGSTLDEFTQQEQGTATAIVDTSSDPMFRPGSLQTFVLASDVLTWTPNVNFTFCRTFALADGVCG